MWSKLIWFMLAGPAVPRADSIISLVNPNPILIGRPLEVKCSVDAIGGLNELQGIGALWMVETMWLYRKTPNDSLALIAGIRAFLLFNTEELGKTLPKGVNRSNIIMEGFTGPDGKLKTENNAVTLSITMRVKKAEVEHVTEYVCKMAYVTWGNRQTDVRSFTEKTIATPQDFLGVDEKGVDTENGTVEENGDNEDSQDPSAHQDVEFYDKAEWQVVMVICGLAIVSVVVYLAVSQTRWTVVKPPAGPGDHVEMENLAPEAESSEISQGGSMSSSGSSRTRHSTGFCGSESAKSQKCICM